MPVLTWESHRLRWRNSSLHPVLDELLTTVWEHGAAGVEISAVTWRYDLPADQRAALLWPLRELVKLNPEHLTYDTGRCGLPARVVWLPHRQRGAAATCCESHPREAVA